MRVCRRQVSQFSIVFLLLFLHTFSILHSLCASLSFMVLVNSFLTLVFIISVPIVVYMHWAFAYTYVGVLNNGRDCHFVEILQNIPDSDFFMNHCGAINTSEQEGKSVSSVLLFLYTYFHTSVFMYRSLLYSSSFVQSIIVSHSLTRIYSYCPLSSIVPLQTLKFCIYVCRCFSY